MRELPQEFRLALDDRFQAYPFVWLLEVDVPTDPVQVVRLANGDKRIDFDSENNGTPRTFYPARFAFEEISLDTEGSLPNLALSMSNITREAMAILIENDFLVQQKVKLTLVNVATLDNPEAKIAFNLEVRSTTANSSVITFNLSSYSLNAVIAPARRLNRSFCDFAYGGALCGFDIDTVDPGLATLGLCIKTEAACTLRGDEEVTAGLPRKHPERIGLFKGLPLAGR